MPARDDATRTRPDTSQRADEIITFTLDPDDNAAGACRAGGILADPSIVLGLPEFVRAVTELGIADAAELQALAADPPAAVLSLSRRLVNAGMLTPFQATALTSTLLIGNYLILDMLGHEGIGSAFRARHRQSGRTAALKVVPAALASEQNALMHLRRDLEAAARLDHPNLVPLNDAAFDRAVPFIVTDFVDGRDLSQIVRERGPMHVNPALDCVIQAARGLAAAHAQGIIHKNIKPTNLLLDKATRAVRVTDLGWALYYQAPRPNARGASGRLSESDSNFDSSAYLAPEQTRGSQRVSHRADICSLGYTLYFLLTGRAPFPSGTTPAHDDRPAPLLRTSRPDVPAAVETAYLRMVVDRPEDRPSRMTEVIEILEAAKSAIAASAVRASEPGRSRHELPAGMEKPLKRAAPRGTTPDGSVFARPGRRHGSNLDPNLNLEDVVADARSEAPPVELPEHLLPPSSRERFPARLRPTGSRRRLRAGDFVLLAIVPIAAITTAWFAIHLWLRSSAGKKSAVRENETVVTRGNDRRARAAEGAPAALDRRAGQDVVIEVRPATREPAKPPDPRHREIAGWGLAVDPDADCQIHADRNTLTITVPPNLHDLNAYISTYNAPRVIRDITGDFDAQVRVDGDFTPGGICTRPGAIPFVGAGLVICSGADNFVRLERGTINDQGRLNSYTNFQHHIEGKRVLDHNGELSSGTAYYLRLARRGSIIRGYISGDGTQWFELEPIRAVLPTRLEVGLDAINSGNAPFTARFSEFSIKSGAGGATR